MTPDDLGGYASLSDPQIHPDGVRIAFAVSRMNLQEDRYDRQIWLWNGTTARPFTHGPGDTRPRWSPNGTRLAFLRAPLESGKPAQVGVMDASGGEAAVITSFDLGASEVEWAPDGSRLAVIGSEWLEPEVTEEERKRRPRRIGGPGYRFDNL
ncbi:MAG TPA: serine hydrolase, partial [Acidimicrobiia bacterium]|nr:serine hydrolase [Acidimicrobiia bacterium]